MKFTCPYCRMEYNTTHDFSDGLKRKIECVSCSRLFLPGAPIKVQTPVVTQEPTVVYVAPKKREREQDGGLFTSTNILAGFGLYSLFK